jgi:hypothetical protein
MKRSARRTKNGVIDVSAAARACPLLWRIETSRVDASAEPMRSRTRGCSVAEIVTKHADVMREGADVRKGYRLRLIEFNALGPVGTCPSLELAFNQTSVDPYDQLARPGKPNLCKGRNGLVMATEPVGMSTELRPCDS